MIRLFLGRYGRPASRARRVADAWPLWAVLFCGLAVPARAQTNSDLPFDPVGKTCYLQVNMWHDARNRIATLNLSEGERIAMGVKAVIRAFDAERIVFAIENKGEPVSRGPPLWPPPRRFIVLTRASSAISPTARWRSA